MFHPHFDQIYCLSLKKREDRRFHFREEATRLSFCFKLWDAIPFEEMTCHIDFSQTRYVKMNHTPGNYSQTMNAREIIVDAISKKHERILFFEDDCVFLENVEEVYKNAFLTFKRKWDLFYLGFHHIKPPISIDLHVDKVVECYYSHAVAINRSAFTKILAKLDGHKPFDLILGQDIVSMGDSYATKIPIIVQRKGFSDISKVYK